MANQPEDKMARAIFRRGDLHETTPPGKVAVIGCGHVGAAIAYALCIENLCSEVALVDVDEKKLQGELTDLQHAAAWAETCISGDTSLDVTKGSKLCVVTATAPHDEDNLLEKNVAIFKELIPQLVQLCPNCLLLVVTNPVETMTYVAWKLSGLPESRVLGAGTVLDSARFRWGLARRLGVHPSAVRAGVSGAHEDILVFNWCGVHVSGTPLLAVKKDICKEENTFTNEIKQASKDIVSGKGYVSWGVALGVAAICRALLLNTLEILPVATYVKGCRHSSDRSDVFLSMASVLCENGVHSVVKSQLTTNERYAIIDVAKQQLSAQADTGV
ncbi:L-lactate dehydrogenase-like [Bacillus rossius redtenbacheri]|uniref:L-lactate dehydrogenase-like n=1 Tax=Bacillus rossius redtenbacheri TaxID=93214 RepID=UPI002FDCF12B